MVTHRVGLHMRQGVGRSRQAWAAHATEPPVHTVRATMRTVCVRPASTTGATKLSNSTLHYGMHCLSYCSLALFMSLFIDTVHMVFTNLVSDPIGPRKKKDPQNLGRHTNKGNLGNGGKCIIVIITIDFNVPLCN